MKLLNVKPKIEIIGRQRSWVPEYIKSFEKIGPAPDLVVIGFSNTIVQSLFSIPKMLMNPKLALRRIQALQQKKKQSGGIDISTLPIQTLTLANGKRIWLMQNVYGDLVLDVAKALDQYGVKNVLYSGTAGSLNADLGVGSMIQPAKWKTDDQKTEDLNWIKPLSAAPVRGLYERVATPNIETLSWLKDKTSQGIDFIEVEVGHLLNFYKSKPQTSFNAVVVISDTLVGPDKKDMTTWGQKDLAPLFSTFRRLIAEKLGLSPKDLKVKDYRSYNPGSNP